ncbi:thioredoxin domain-containing protein [Streptomyces sp. NPDC005483]|uniref:thioredoxin domain-containing protein n=1 Tax=Streptomyces sp. NPDC005483 TaxID=3154882 RepID=UPI0033AB3ACE
MTSPNALVTVTEQELDAVVASSPVPVLLYVSADWCGPCKMLEPIVEEMAAEFGQSLRVLKIDHDQAPAVRTAYDIAGTPTLLLLYGGDLLAKIVGAWPKEELLAQLRPLIEARPVGVSAVEGPREREGLDPTPPGWTAQGPRRLEFPDEVTAKLAMFGGWLPDDHELIAAQGVVEVPAGRVVWLFVHPPTEGDAPAGPIDLTFLRRLPADGIDKLVVQAPEVSAAALADIATQTGLRKLAIYTKRLIDIEAYDGALRALSQLDELRLDTPEADDRVVADLAALPRLRSLYLCADGVTDAGLALLADAPGLRSLYLDTHQATDAGLAQVAAGLTDLFDLGICLTETTDAGIAALAPLTALEDLTITAPKVTPAGVREVARLRQLSGLSLYNTAADDDTVDSLAALTGLTYLTVSGDGVEVSDAAYLRLRSALPTITINGVWLAPQAVRHALSTKA